MSQHPSSTGGRLSSRGISRRSTAISSASVIEELVGVTHAVTRGTPSVRPLPATHDSRASGALFMRRSSAASLAALLYSTFILLAQGLLFLLLRDEKSIATELKTLPRDESTFLLLRDAKHGSKRAQNTAHTEAPKHGSKTRLQNTAQGQ